MSACTKYLNFLNSSFLSRGELQSPCQELYPLPSDLLDLKDTSLWTVRIFKVYFKGYKCVFFNVLSCTVISLALVVLYSALMDKTFC